MREKWFLYFLSQICYISYSCPRWCRYYSISFYGFPVSKLSEALDGWTDKQTERLQHLMRPPIGRVALSITFIQQTKGMWGMRQTDRQTNTTKTYHFRMSRWLFWSWFDVGLNRSILTKICTKDNIYIFVPSDLWPIDLKFAPLVTLVQVISSLKFRSFYGFPVSRKSAARDGGTARRTSRRMRCNA